MATDKSGVSKSAPASPLGNRPGSLPDAGDTAFETPTEGNVLATLRKWVGETLIWSRRQIRKMDAPPDVSAREHMAREMLSYQGKDDPFLSASIVLGIEDREGIEWSLPTASCNLQSCKG